MWPSQQKPLINPEELKTIYFYESCFRPEFRQKLIEIDIIKFFYDNYFVHFSKELLRNNLECLTFFPHRDWAEFAIGQLEKSSYPNKYGLLEITTEIISTYNLPKSVVEYLFSEFGFFKAKQFDNDRIYTHNKEEITRFIVLSFLQYCNTTLSITNPATKKNDIIDFQQKIFNTILSNEPVENRVETLQIILSIFERFNQLNIFTEKFSLSFEKILYDKGRPLDGEIFLSWNRVEFYNGFYLIYHPSFPTGAHNRGPLKIDDPKCRKIFGDIKGYFLKKLAPLHVEAKNGKIVNLLNKTTLDSCISVLEHHVLGDLTERIKQPITPQIEKKIITKAEAHVMIKGQKSRYLDFLCSRQLDEYNVVCCIENRVNTNGTTVEYSFIFTIKETLSLVYLAFENSNDSRCTYIFTIPRHKWQDSVDRIYEFFASNVVNKRQALSQRIADLRLPGNYEYIRILHTDYSKWTQRIRVCR